MKKKNMPTINSALHELNRSNSVNRARVCLTGERGSQIGITVVGGEKL